MDSNSPGNQARSFPKPLWKNQEHPCFPLTMAIPLLGSQQQPSPAEQRESQPNKQPGVLSAWDFNPSPKTMSL